MVNTRIFLVRLNVIEPLDNKDPDLSLIESLNRQGIEVIGEVSAEKYNDVLPLLKEPYKEN